MQCKLTLAYGQIEFLNRIRVRKLFLIEFEVSDHEAFFLREVFLTRRILSLLRVGYKSFPPPHSNLESRCKS